MAANYRVRNDQSMDIIEEELTTGLPDARELLKVAIRLLAATLLGAIRTAGREDKKGKNEGKRT